MDSMIKVSDFVVRFLEQNGIDTVFGYSGGAIAHLMDSFSRSAAVRFIQTYHEQTAAIAAEGYAWQSKNIGVATATSGPGATNLITGIADAYFDSIPTLYITGQVNTYEHMGDKPIRQQGFQETDIVSIVRPITKYATMLTAGSNIRYELEKAYHIAMEGRKGPVLLDLPMDIQREIVDQNELSGYDGGNSGNLRELRYLAGFSREKLAHKLAASVRPLLLLGGGVVLSGACTHAKKLARELGMPVVVSLLGKGSFPEDDSLFVGMIGSYGNRCANIALANSDLVISLGSRMDTRQTGTNIASFVRSGRIVRVDIDENEILHHRLPNVDGIVGDIKIFVEEALGMAGHAVRTEWINFVDSIKSKYSQEVEVERNVENKKPYQVMDILNRYASRDQLYTVDIGQNQMFAAQKLALSEGQEWKTSGGLAPMGFALPAAIGACFAGKQRSGVFSIIGDGGLQIALQSLMLLSQYSLPIKVILLNNRSLGMITQFQDLYFDMRKEGTTKESGYLVPDFMRIAQAYGLPYHLVKDGTYRNYRALGKMFSEPGPAIIEFELGEDTAVAPKLEVNMPIEDLSPRLNSEELSRTMLVDMFHGGG